MKACTECQNGVATSRPTGGARNRRPIHDFVLTGHARQRAAQRNLSEDDIRYVVAYGHVRHAAGARIFYLRKVDIPTGDLPVRDRIEGTAVVMATDRPVVLTVWRNRQTGAKHIRQKPQRWWSMPSSDLSLLDLAA